MGELLHFVGPRSFARAVMDRRLNPDQMVATEVALARGNSESARNLGSLLERVRTGQLVEGEDLESAGSTIEALTRQVIRFDDRQTVTAALASTLASVRRSSAASTTGAVGAIALNPPLITGPALAALVKVGFLKIRNQLLLVPGGTFKMGYDGMGALEIEKPVRRVIVSSFRMSKDDVTNGEYQTWVESLGDKRFFSVRLDEKGWPVVVAMGTRRAVEDYNQRDRDLQIWEAEPYKPFRDLDQQNQPVNVNHFSAFLYAFMHGTRLPMGKEFEFAASEGGLRLSYNPAAIYTGHASPRLATIGVDDSRYADGPYGLRHLMGNVLVWMIDQSKSGYAELRGASFLDYGLRARRPSFHRYISPTLRDKTIGFRLVLEGPRK